MGIFFAFTGRGILTWFPLDPVSPGAGKALDGSLFEQIFGLIFGKESSGAPFAGLFTLITERRFCLGRGRLALSMVRACSPTWHWTLGHRIASLS